MRNRGDFMLLDEMHEDGHHMMDWMSWGELNWILVLIGWIIFLLFVTILLYLLYRGTNQIMNDDKIKSQPNRELASVGNIDESRDESAYFCPNCGGSLDNKTLRYCPKCGSEI